ncbi:hypothetical protein J8J14_11055 [Roseomonas sp. SSH11]|uniref:Uncharacterized protein n=1 Tax=Pararoseomonas baculiformis TaxID=2820812 RepID=A0ABS4AE84_9PROT|nr:hypothetical protein [Pararoseomonas baculiformis]MBP0445317.1 hypothetical protein [Pararoseomonas baculiformis]
MRFHSLIAALLLISPIAVPAAALAQPRQVAEATAEAPALTGKDILFAYHRMAGTEPDFALLAEQAVDSRPPPLHPVRDPERERRYLIRLAERRLKAEFAGFDLNRAFSIRISAEILGYDRERGGIPLRAGGLRGVFLRDPTDGSRGFSLRFRNADALGVIPAADAEAAARLLQDAQLASLGDRAGTGGITIRFAFAGALPQAEEVKDAPVLAEIVSAQVDSAAGLPVHGFRSLGSLSAAARSRRAGPPVLAEADLAGLGIGMPLAQAQAAARREYPESLGQAFYEGLPELVRRGRGQPECSTGLVADIRAFELPVAPEDSFEGCIAFSASPEEDPAAAEVARVVQLRFLPGALPDEVRQELEERFGPVLEELPTGQLLWIGRHPAQGAARGAARGAAPGLLELRAEFVRVAKGGPDRVPGTLLSMTLQRHAPEDGSGG